MKFHKWNYAIIPLGLYFAGVFLVFPLLIQVAVKIVCEKENSANDDDCSSDEIATKVSWIATIIVSLLLYCTILY